MSRTLEEDFILAQKEEALEEALESGIHVTREHVIGAFLYMARKMLASGIAFDDVVEAIPEEFREEVSERLVNTQTRACCGLPIFDNQTRSATVGRIMSF